MPSLPPKPERPTIVDLAPPEAISDGGRVPIVRWVDDTVPREWLCGCPVYEGWGGLLAAAMAGTADPDDAAAVFAHLAPLPEERIVSESWPDFTDAIDLKAIGGATESSSEQSLPKLRSAYVTVLDVDRPVLVRVCHGAAGMNVAARMWLAGREVGHGDLVRLAPGRYPMVAEAYHGEPGRWLPWDLARLAPRLTEVTEQEVGAVHAWELSLWQATADAFEVDEAALLDQVTIDEATASGTDGYFRVGRSAGGRWWFIDPDGRPFYHRGCTGLNAGGTGGRRVGLPPVPKATVRQWIDYLKAWGFNALGSWTTPEFFDTGLPYAEVIEGYYVEPWLVTKFPDVFDPAWAANIDGKCHRLCAPLRESRELIGYFLENERGFMDVPRYGERLEPRSPAYRYAGPIRRDGLVLAAEPQLNVRGLGLLQFCLSLEGSPPAGQKAWEFVRERHGDLAGLSQAWGIDLADERDVARLTHNEVILISETYLADLADFVRLWGDRYFRVMVEAIRRHDPNHLILGVRWGGTPSPAILEVEARWTDVVSQNNYRAEFYESTDRTYEVSGRPILNGELSCWTDSFEVVRNPIEPPGGYSASERQRVRARTALDRIFTHPGVVGYTKYRWHKGGDKLWGDDDEPNWRVVEPLRAANARAVPIAAAWDRPPLREPEPLTGQVFLTLQGGAVTVDELPPARPGDRASLRYQYAPLHLGLVCRQGEWDGRVRGDGIRGEVVSARTRGRSVEMTVRIERISGVIACTEGKGEYGLHLEQDGTKLEGRFEGAFNGHAASGRALGFLFRPVPTVRL